jgi:hypothetical protein
MPRCPQIHHSQSAWAIVHKGQYKHLNTRQTAWIVLPNQLSLSSLDGLQYSGGLLLCLASLSYRLQLDFRIAVIAGGLKAVRDEVRRLHLLLVDRRAGH